MTESRCKPASEDQVPFEQHRSERWSLHKECGRLMNEPPLRDNVEPSFGTLLSLRPMAES